MQCPVCKTECPIQNDADEIYYDCLNCDSSLLFNKGNCVVLSTGSPKQETRALVEERSTERTSSQAKGITKSIHDKQEEDTKNDIQEENLLEKEQDIESPLSQGATYKGPSLKTQSELLPPQKDTLTEEEDFAEGSSSEYKTEVPELTQSEEELSSQNMHEQEEKGDTVSKEEGNETEIIKKDSSANLCSDSTTKPDASQLEEDFVFEEETPNEEQSMESKSVESPDPAPSQKEDFAEVAEFGNTQDEDRQGAFLYDLMLSEINSFFVREKVFSILADESLNLPLNKDNIPIKDCIKDGQITLSKISPVQAYVIVTFLMGLPLNISWNQSHIAESS